MRSNERGQSAVPILAGIVAILVMAGFIMLGIKSCDSPEPTRHVHIAHGHRASVKGKFLTPTGDGRGRYAYQDNSGNWFIYYWLLMPGNSYTSYYSNPTPNFTAPTTLPAGGSWQKTEVAPDVKEIVAEVEEPVAETDAGLPETDNEFEVENQSVEPENYEAPGENDSGGGDGGGSSD